MEILYRCSRCDNTYRSEQECLAHEEKHVAPRKIVNCYGNDFYTVYPKYIAVRMSDFRTVVYKYDEDETNRKHEEDDL